MPLNIYHQCITDLYKGKQALRSQVPYIKHIDEGLTILRFIGSSQVTMDAYCIHPVIQEDANLRRLMMHGIPEDWSNEAVALAFEYRRVANAHLSTNSEVIPQGDALTPLMEVRDMLIADKIQNRKDFDLYHRKSHPRREILIHYFDAWLRALGVTESRYQEILSQFNDEPVKEDIHHEC